MAEKAQQQSVNKSSIWFLVSEDDFRKSIVALEQRTNAVPTDVQRFEPSNLLNADGEIGRLPFVVEQQFVNDIAFIAALNEGAQSVAAVYLEQYVVSHPRIVLRIAAADASDTAYRSALRLMCNTVQRVNESGASLQNLQDEIFQLIIDLHQDRILGRLRSSRWQKPKYLIASHKKPLWKDFANVTHRVRHVFPGKRDRKQREVVENLLLRLVRQYEDFETAEGSLSVHLAVLVKQTFDFCKNKDIRGFYERLSASGATAQISAALKCLHQFEKIGCYFRIARDMINTAILYPSAFSKIELDHLTPYPTQPTTIAYEPWARKCHVHAEIQLLIDFDMRQTARSDTRSGCEVYSPRVIGTSKYFCYLCYLFIKEHGYFFVANTHGRLYDQWTVPDLVHYETNTRVRYAEILARMTMHVQQVAQRPPFWRPEPMTSRQNLLSNNTEDNSGMQTDLQGICDLAEDLQSNLTQ